MDEPNTSGAAPCARLEDRPAQPYLGISCPVTNGVPAAVDAAFPRLFARLGELGVPPAGPPLIRTHLIDPGGEPLLLEVAVPVAAHPADAAGPPDAGAAAGAGLVASVLPAGRYAVAEHVGAYRSATERDLADARADLVAWMDARSLVHRRPPVNGRALPCAFEQFWIGPVDEPDHHRWRTTLAFLVEES
jgi:hypothetical protein